MGMIMRKDLAAWFYGLFKSCNITWISMHGFNDENNNNSLKTR